MSIFATWLTIEDEREWVADLQGEGIKAGVIRDGDPSFDDHDAPLVYQGSHVLPDEDSPRGGHVEFAAIPAHVRYWRENPGAPGATEPEGVDAWIRLSVNEGTVLLTERQVRRLRDGLTEWLEARARGAA